MPSIPGINIFIDMGGVPGNNKFPKTLSSKKDKKKDDKKGLKEQTSVLAKALGDIKSELKNLPHDSHEGGG